MGLAKKGSSAIEVQGSRYRWAVAPSDGFMALVVQAAAGRGQRLSIKIDYDDERPPGGLGMVQRREITPDLVRLLILKSLALGWQPTQAGKAIRYVLKGDVLSRPSPAPR